MSGATWEGSSDTAASRAMASSFMARDSNTCDQNRPRDECQTNVRAHMPCRNAPGPVYTCARAVSQCSRPGVHARTCRVAMLPARCTRAHVPCRNAPGPVYTCAHAVSQCFAPSVHVRAWPCRNASPPVWRCAPAVSQRTTSDAHVRTGPLPRLPAAKALLHGLDLAADEVDLREQLFDFVDDGAAVVLFAAVSLPLCCQRAPQLGAFAGLHAADGADEWIDAFLIRDVAEDFVRRQFEDAGQRQEKAEVEILFVAFDA